MSRRTALSIVTSLAICALPAAEAAAKPKTVQSSFKAGAAAVSVSEAHTLKTATGLGRIRTSSAKLSLARDRKVDARALRGIKIAGKRAGRRLRAVMASDKTVDARVLLLAGTGNEPTFTWWKTMLAGEGVPFDAIITGDSDAITQETLQHDDQRGKYQAIVLATGTLTDCSVSPCADTMGPDAWAALKAYEVAFAVREIGAYGWPSPAYGTEWGGDCGDKSEIAMKVTSAGASVFADLAGPVPTDKAVYGCETTPLEKGSWQTLVEGPKGAVVGTAVRSDGVETMFNSIDGSDWTIHSRLLFHGMLKWVTKGVYLGSYRNYLGVDVDDVFLGNDRWDASTNLLNPDENTVIRMSAGDVLRAASWQRQTGVTLNMLFNAAGADTSIKRVKDKRGRVTYTADLLTQALMAAKHEFRWTSHTFTHDNLDLSTQAEIEKNVTDNIAFANKNKLPGFNKSELTTGQHSGLANPAMGPALTATGIRSIGSDASRGKDAAALGSATTLPRYPTGVYYNVGTKAEQLDEYNYLNYEICGGGPGCLKAPADWDTYVSNEATMILRHMLANDPRPHYVHQSNLAQDGTLYPVIDEVLRRYRSYLKVPFAQLSYTDAGATLQQQAAWSGALAAGSVSGVVSASGLNVTSSVPNLAVPVTGTRLGSVYGGVRTGWQRLAAGTTALGF